jgi:CheY-like chemotaxis protein
MTSGLRAGRRRTRGPSSARRGRVCRGLDAPPSRRTIVQLSAAPVAAYGEPSVIRTAAHSPTSVAPTRAELETITVLVVDDHPGCRRALERALRRAPGLTLIGCANNGEEAIRMSARLEPRVVVMDLAMPGVSGVEATRRLMRQPRPPAVVALSGSRELMRDAIAAGACTGLLKEGDLTELLTGIRAASAR